MKCYSCAATIGALDKICPYCCAEIVASVMPSVAASPSQVSPAAPTAASLCEKIQDDLAALAQKSPTSRIRSSVVGLLTPPTLGLAFILSKAFEVFGRSGESASRLVLSIDENLRKGMISYKNDAAVAGSLRKFEGELAAYHAAKQTSYRFFWAGCGASVVVIAALLLAVGMRARQEVGRRADSLSSTVARVQAGDLLSALTAMAKLPDAERAELAAHDPLAKAVGDLLNGRDREALDLVQGIADPKARVDAVNFIGQRMVSQALGKQDYQAALAAAALLAPDSNRFAAEDTVRTRQATALIGSSQMDTAKAVIANIRDATTRMQLEKTIEAKVPKTKLDGF